MDLFVRLIRGLEHRRGREFYGCLLAIANEFYLRDQGLTYAFGKNFKPHEKRLRGLKKPPEGFFGRCLFEVWKNLSTADLRMAVP